MDQSNLIMTLKNKLCFLSFNRCLAATDFTFLLLF